MPTRRAAPRGAVKSTTVVPITTPLNISALAREHGVSRKTITRRLAKGWRPSAAPIPCTPAQPTANRSPSMLAPGHRAADPTLLDEPIRLWVTPPHTLAAAHVRPPLGVVRGVLLLLAVAFYAFVACAAVGR
jgi:hypothetical protein